MSKLEYQREGKSCKRKNKREDNYKLVTGEPTIKKIILHDETTLGEKAQNVQYCENKIIVVKQESQHAHAHTSKEWSSVIEHKAK